MYKKFFLTLFLSTISYSINAQAQVIKVESTKNPALTMLRDSNNIDTNNKTLENKKPMKKKNGPASSLTPFILSHQKVLKLTISQKEKIFSWLQQQKKIVQRNMPAFITDSETLNKALMNKEPPSEINILKQQVINDQKDMLNQDIDQTRFYQNLLTNQQWEKLKNLYEN